MQTKRTLSEIGVTDLVTGGVWVELKFKNSIDTRPFYGLQTQPYDA